MRPLVALVMCAWFAPYGAAAVDWPAVNAQLDEAVADAADQRRAAGVALVIVHAGEQRVAIAHGLADKRSGVRLTVDTPMPIGDASRLFTAALAMRAVDRKSLVLDAPIATDLSVGFSQDASAVTPRQLLTHHSGLAPNWLRGMFYQDGEADPLPEVLPLNYAPGELMNSSNLGYVVLGRLLQKAAGVSFESLLTTELLSPLGLAHTGTAVHARTARAHRKGKTLDPLMARDTPALGVIASAADLGRLLIALDAESPGVWLSRESRLAMVAPQNANNVWDVGNLVGLGWELVASPRPGVGLIATQSSTYPNFRAEVRWLPQHRLGVIALANWREAYEPLDDLVAQAIDMVLLQQRGITPREEDRPLPESVALPKGAEPTRFAARYATPLGIMEFAPEGQRFDVQFLGLDFRADPRPDGWWSLRFRFWGVLPISIDAISRVLIRPVLLGGRASMLAFAQDRYFLFGSKIESDAIDLESLTGTYVLSNPDALTKQLEIEQIELEVVDGVAALAYELPFILTIRPRVALAPLGGERYAVAGFGPNLGDAVRVVRGDRARIEYSGYVAEKVE